MISSNKWIQINYNKACKCQTVSLRVLCFPSSRAHIWLVPVPVLVSSLLVHLSPALCINYLVKSPLQKPCVSLPLCPVLKSFWCVYLCSSDLCVSNKVCKRSSTPLRSWHPRAPWQKTGPNKTSFTEMEIAARFIALAHRDLPFPEYSREFCGLAAATALDDATILSLFLHGANSHRPLDLPDTKGLCWREGILRCLESVLTRARTSRPSSAATPSPPRRILCLLQDSALLCLLQDGALLCLLQDGALLCLLQDGALLCLLQDSACLCLLQDSALLWPL